MSFEVFIQLDLLVTPKIALLVLASNQFPKGCNVLSTVSLPPCLFRLLALGGCRANYCSPNEGRGKSRLSLFPPPIVLSPLASVGPILY